MTINMRERRGVQPEGCRLSQKEQRRWKGQHQLLTEDQHKNAPGTQPISQPRIKQWYQGTLARWPLPRRPSLGRSKTTPLQLKIRTLCTETRVLRTIRTFTLPTKSLQQKSSWKTTRRSNAILLIKVSLATTQCHVSVSRLHREQRAEKGRF